MSMRWTMALGVGLLAGAWWLAMPVFADEGADGAAAVENEKPGHPPRRPPLTSEMKEKLRAKFDADGDGTLSSEEREAMKADMARRRAEKIKGEGHKRPTREEILAKFDANGDGKLTGEEFSKARAARKAHGQGGQGEGNMRAAIMREFDADGDGTLNEQEKAAAMQARQRALGGGMQGAGGMHGGGMLGAGGNEEFKARLLKQFDADGNGQLEGAEMARAREAAARFQALQRRGGPGMRPNFQGQPGGRMRPGPGGPGGGMIHGPGGPGGGPHGGGPRR